MPYRMINCSSSGFRASIRFLEPAGNLSIAEDTAHELRDCCAQLAVSDEIRVVTITGCGGAFAVGRQGPPDEIVDAPISRRLDWIAGMSVASAFASLPMPTIAILNGDATGHGLELAIAADLRIAADTANLGTGGLLDCGFPYDGGTQRLPRLVGPGLARDMLFTGRVLSAREALEVGLVNRVVPAENLGEVSSDLASQIASAAPIASRYAKEAVTASGELTLTQGLRLEADLSIILHSTEDRAEGLQSFADKRVPKFEGR